MCYDAHILSLFCSTYYLHTLCRLREECNHIATVISCLVRASEVQSKSSTKSYTSQKCSSLPASQGVHVTAVYSFILFPYLLNSSIPQFQSQHCVSAKRRTNCIIAEHIQQTFQILYRTCTYQTLTIVDTQMCVIHVFHVSSMK